MNATAVLRSVAVPTVHVADVVSACVAQLRNHVRWCVCVPNDKVSAKEKMVLRLTNIQPS